MERKTNLKGYNSFVANEPFEEFQVDPCLFGGLKDKEFKGGLAIIDIFSKYATFIPTTDNKAPTFLEALKKGIHNMGGKPKTNYADSEGAWFSKDIIDYLEGNNKTNYNFKSRQCS